MDIEFNLRPQSRQLRKKLEILCGGRVPGLLPREVLSFVPARGSEAAVGARLKPEGVYSVDPCSYYPILSPARVEVP